MNLAGGRESDEATIGAGDHVLAPDHAGKARNALGNGFGMLDQIGGIIRNHIENQLVTLFPMEREPSTSWTPKSAVSTANSEAST
jgi:hypothetical protein